MMDFTLVIVKAVWILGCGAAVSDGVADSTMAAGAEE
jgi:hypothetical protein